MISYLRQTYFFFPKVDIRCGGRSVENSPFPLNVAQPKTAVVRLRQPEESENKYLVRRELDIALDAAEDTRNLSSYVDGPDEENVPASFDKGDDGLYHLKKRIAYFKCIDFPLIFTKPVLTNPGNHN